jgi:hypothetical protein
VKEHHVSGVMRGWCAISSTLSTMVALSIKKVAGVAAIVVNCNSIISLERIVKLRNKGTVSMWHEGFLNCV